MVRIQPEDLKDPCEGLFGEACGDDNWQAELPVGDTGRVFDILTSVLILHNHPSGGDPLPSPEDVELTRRLAAAGVLMGIDVIDHVVLGDVRYWSFKEAGRL